MDIRIVNTCNNNCLYCLEQSYRDKEKFIDKNFVFDEILGNKTRDNMTFYWWNPLLHQDIWEIVSFTKNAWYSWIGILTNTGWLNEKYLNLLIRNGLWSIWFYFHSFDKITHDTIVDGWIKFEELLNNIAIIRNSWIFYKAVIHVNKQNIHTLHRDVCILNKKYWVESFEFINYFPFDRPYEKFRNLLEYDYNTNRPYIDVLFEILVKLKVNVYFAKFSRDFFWAYQEFYDFEGWILQQIWDEDVLRLKENNPFCLKQKRCKSCFIKDNCRAYGT